VKLSSLLEDKTDVRQGECSPICEVEIIADITG
jgi:hypothetical protein